MSPGSTLDVPAPDEPGTLAAESSTEPGDGHAPGRGNSPGSPFLVTLLCAYAVAITAIPGDMVVRFIGGVGNVGGLISLAALGLWGFGSALGLHDPRRFSNPARTAALVLLLTVLLSYAIMHTRAHDGDVIVASDRSVFQVIAWTGAVVAASDFLTRIEDVRLVMRWLTIGAGFCGAVAAGQYWLNIDVSSYIRSIPVLYSQGGAWSDMRGGLNRVAGTAQHPIELGVVSAILLPIAVHVALFDRGRTALRRWLPVVLIGVAISTSVSRSAILATAIVVLVLLVLMPAHHRLGLLMAIPVGLLAVAVAARGLIRTLWNLTALGSDDASIQGRLTDLGLVGSLVREHPVAGWGPGGWQPGNMLEILDNAYFGAAVTTGLVGLVGLIAYATIPALTALDARRRNRDPGLRGAATALAAGQLAAMVSFAAFDALSFPMMGAVTALMAGLTGAVWRIATTSPSPTRSDPPSLASPAQRLGTSTARSPAWT